MHAIETSVKTESQKGRSTTPQGSDGVGERRTGDRRRSAEDRRFWRALMTERRVSERRQASRLTTSAPDTGKEASQVPPPEAPVVTPADANPLARPKTPPSRIVSRRAKAAPSTTDAPSSREPDSVEATGRMSTHSTATASSTKTESARRARLKSMLDAANQRQAKSVARRHRRPVMAAGVKVRIVAGEHTNAAGTIIDADHIEGRALIDVPGELLPVWVGFRDLAAAGASSAH